MHLAGGLSFSLKFSTISDDQTFYEMQKTSIRGDDQKGEFSGGEVDGRSRTYKPSS